MSQYLFDVIPSQVIGYLTTNLPAAISQESSAFPDGITPLVMPEQTYDYEEAEPPQCPALYVIIDRVDFRLQGQGANHINALATVRCGMIVEEFQASALAHAARRYASILHQVLHGSQIDYTVSSVVKVRNIVKVSATSFGESFRKNAEAGEQDGPYRKEFVHELQIEHYENFS